MTGGSPGLTSIPLCDEDAPDATSSESNAGDGLGNALAGLVKNQMDQMKNLEKDPEFIKLRDGYWAFFHNKKDPNSGKNCSAMFMSLKGAVQISGPGTSYQHAVLVIMGLNIPRPKKLEVVKVNLDQGESAPQNTFAWNYTVVDGQLGAIGFAVPSIEAALAGMKDELPFKVSMDGKVVADVIYYDGLKARSALQQCLNGHPVEN